MFTFALIRELREIEYHVSGNRGSKFLFLAIFSRNNRMWFFVVKPVSCEGPIKKRIK